MSEKHLRITHDEFLAINDRLTEGELRVYFYLRTLDPFGDLKLTIDTSVISERLGLVRRTVQKCLKSLESKKLIDWEVVVSRISTYAANVGSPSESRIAKRTQDRLGESRIVSANVGSPMRTQDREQPLEVNQGICPTTPHPSSTFSNLSQSDRSEDFYDFSNTNSENLQEAIATQPNNYQTQESRVCSQIIQTDQIRSKSENFELENHEVETKVNQKIPIPETKDYDPEKDFKDFIIETIEKDRKIKIANREAYLSKVLAKDCLHWRSLYEQRNRPKPKARDVIAEDIWRLEASLSSAIKMLDYEFAIARLENIPEMKEQIFAKHPEWEKLLCR